MSLAQPAEDPSKERGLSVCQALGWTLWGGFCGQCDPQGGSGTPHCPPPVRWTPLCAQVPRWAALCAQVPRPCPDSATAEPCGFGADASPARPGSPRGGTSRGCTGPTSLCFPWRLGRDALGEVPAPSPGGGCWQRLGRLPGTGGRNVETTRLVCKAHSCKAADAVLRMFPDPLEADTGCGRSLRGACPPSPRGRSRARTGRQGGRPPPRQMTLQSRGFA